MKPERLNELRRLVGEADEYDSVAMFGRDDMRGLIKMLDHETMHRKQLLEGLQTFRGMVREAIETLFGPVASLESEDATLLRGPEPCHDAEGVIEALQRVKAALEAKRISDDERT